MTVRHVVLLRKIVINATNKAIRISEGGAPETVNLVEGEYFLDCAGDDGDDLLTAVATALTTHSGGNTYAGTIVWSADPAGVQATVTIAQTGGATFQILWTDAATTFDGALLGFVADTSSSTAAKASTTSPTAAWVADQPQREIIVDVRQDATVVETEAGDAHSVQYGGPYVARTIEFRFIAEVRAVNGDNLLGDSSASMLAFINRCVGGGEFLIYQCTISSGFTLNPPQDFEALDERTFVFAQETAGSLRPRRYSSGLALYDFDVRCQWRAAA